MGREIWREAERQNGCEVVEGGVGPAFVAAEGGLLTE